MKTPSLSAVLLAASLLSAGCSGGVSGISDTNDGAGESASYEFVSWTGSSPAAGSGFGSSSSAAVLSLPGLGGEFVFAESTRLVENSDGSATLLGWLSSTSDEDARWWIELQMGARRTAGAPHCTPDLGFEDEAYLEHGGPVDPASWHFYRQGTGALVGGGSLAGALADVKLAEGATLQCGMGANNLTTGPGAQIVLDVTLTNQPNLGGGLSTATESTVLAVALIREGTLFAFTGEPDPLYSPYESGHALWLPSLGGVFVFSAGGELFLHGDGTMELVGEVVHVNDPARRLAVDMRFSGRVAPGEANYPPPGSPRLELFPEAYVENGGPVDPSRWTYFTDVRGSLLGRGDLAGARIRMKGTGPASQFGLGANGKNTLNGLSNWLQLTLRTQPDEGPELPAFLEDGDLNVNLGRRLIQCVGDAVADHEVSTLSGLHAFYLPGIGTDFAIQPGGHFIERADGTAVLRGEIARASDPTCSFRVEVRFADRRNPNGPNYPPEGSPKKQLLPAMYKENGGPIDTDVWHYYGETVGELIGLGKFAGAVLDVEQRGPAFQVGEGASGRNLAHGAASWIEATVVSQPSEGPPLKNVVDGDFNIDLGRDCKLCPDAAVSDPVWSSSGSSHALTLPGIAKDLVFESGSTITLGSDGTARLVGVAVRKADAGKRFAVDVTFSGRLDPGDVGHAPEDSPKLELHDDAYAENGGPVDPSTWVYFTETEGVLTGLDDWAGAVVHLTRMGPAFQLGDGASGKNIRYGASGWLVVDVEAQPTVGDVFVSEKGDFNLDLVKCP